MSIAAAAMARWAIFEYMVYNLRLCEVCNRGPFADLRNRLLDFTHLYTLQSYFAKSKPLIFDELLYSPREDYVHFVAVKPGLDEWKHQNSVGH